jgi:hypothetical protein
VQLEIASEDRTVTVAGTTTTFAGMRVVGSARWSGSATLGDVVVTLTTTDPAAVSAIEPIDAGVHSRESDTARSAAFEGVLEVPGPGVRRRPIMRAP